MPGYREHARVWQSMAKVHIEVKKNANENNASLLRRFSRKVMDAGIIQSVKRNRYNARPISKLSQKVMTINRIKRRVEIERLKKLGKIVERKRS